jgi:hypothetical protein
VRCSPQVRVVLKGVGSGKRDVASWVADHGVESAVLRRQGVPLCDLVHVSDRGGGPLTQS